MTPSMFVKDLFKFYVKTYKIIFFLAGFFPKKMFYISTLLSLIFSKNSNSCYLRYIVIIAVVQQRKQFKPSSIK